MIQCIIPIHNINSNKLIIKLPYKYSETNDYPLYFLYLLTYKYKQRTISSVNILFYCFYCNYFFFCNTVLALLKLLFKRILNYRLNFVKFMVIVVVLKIINSVFQSSNCSPNKCSSNLL